MDKIKLRRQIQGVLTGLTAEDRVRKSQLACENLINTPQFAKASVVMVYLSLPHEVDTSALILTAWQRGKTVAVPKVSWQQRHMIPVEINSLETGISKEAGGLRNPTTGIPMAMEDIDLVVTPALAVDRRGNRLGRGGAFYDKFFGDKTLRASKCGFVFSEQVLESVPAYEHDKKVDFLVTDKEVIYVDNGQQGG